MDKPQNSINFKGHFKDKRLDSRANKILSSLTLSRTSSVHGSTRDQAELKGFYRFLDNESVTEEELISGLTSRCKANVTDRDILVIEDTSSYGLNHLKGSLKENSGLGLVGNKIGLGFLTHASLVLDAHTESVLGYGDIQLWHRTEDKGNNTTKKYKNQFIEEKESYKWIRASLRIKQDLHSSKSITIIQDREGDIYQQFCEVHDEKTNLIIRSRDNRKLANGLHLNDALDQSSIVDEILLPITGDLRKKRKPRIARLEVKFCKVSLCKPALIKSQNENLPATFDLYAVEVKEKNPPSKSDTVHWRLLTTLKIQTAKDAQEIINRYKQRWYIEQLFRLTKKQGFKIEQTQLETGWAIRKLFLLVLGAAIKVMQLYLAYDEEKGQNTSEVFSEEEIECLQKIDANIQKTEATSNPHNKDQLSWVTWIIARLGGWKGNKSQQPPGPIILLKGLEKFENMLEGWRLAR